MVSTRSSMARKSSDGGRDRDPPAKEQENEPATKLMGKRRRNGKHTLEEESATAKETTTPIVVQQKQAGSRRKSARKSTADSFADESSSQHVRKDVQEEAGEETANDKNVLQNDAEQQEQQSLVEMDSPRQRIAKPVVAPTVSLTLLKRKSSTGHKDDMMTTDRAVTKKAGNELTKLIPGYVAPFKLDTSSLDPFRPAGGLSELCRRAQETDASTAGFVVTATETHARAMKRRKSGCMPTTYASLYASFKHGTGRSAAQDHSAGAGWFGMVPTPMTDELKTDLAVIRNRNYLDPKRFYKSADKSTDKVVQLGTVIEGSAEFYSSRLTKKQRRTNLTEEIMATSADYTKNKYKQMQQTKSERGRRLNQKKKMSKRARRGY